MAQVNFESTSAYPFANEPPFPANAVRGVGVCVRSRDREHPVTDVWVGNVTLSGSGVVVAVMARAYARTGSSSSQETYGYRDVAIGTVTVTEPLGYGVFRHESDCLEAWGWVAVGEFSEELAGAYSGVFELEDGCWLEAEPLLSGDPQAKILVNGSPMRPGRVLSIEVAGLYTLETTRRQVPALSWEDKPDISDTVGAETLVPGYGQRSSTEVLDCRIRGTYTSDGLSVGMYSREPTRDNDVRHDYPVVETINGGSAGHWLHIGFTVKGSTELNPADYVRVKVDNALRRSEVQMTDIDPYNWIQGTGRRAREAHYMHEWYEYGDTVTLTLYGAKDLPSCYDRDEDGAPAYAPSGDQWSGVTGT